MAGFAPFGQIQTAQAGGRTYQFARGTDNQLWSNDGTGWKSAGGVLTSDPWVQQVPGGWQVYARGTTGDVYKIAEGPTGFANWSDIGKTGPAGSPFAAQNTTQNTTGNATGGLGQGWWSTGALAPGFSGGVMGTPAAGNSATTGTLGSGVADWTLQNGTLYSRLSNNPTDSTVQGEIMRAAAGYLNRGGLSEQQAYNLAVSEALTNINKIGAAPSTYTILPYQQGMVQQYANLMAQGPKAEQNYAAWSPQLQQYMNQAQTWDGQAYRATGKGDLYTAANGANPNQPSGGPTTQNPNPAQPLPNSDPNAPGGGSFLFNDYLLQNPDAAYRYLLQQNGINPDRVGLLGSFIKDAILGSGSNGLLGNLLDTRGLDTGNAVAGTAGFLKNLGSEFFSPDQGAGLQGTIQNALANVAKVAPQQLSGPGIDQNQAMNYLTQVAQLRSYFAPSITQNALASQLRAQAGQYLDASMRGLNGGPQVGSFLQFLPQPVKDMLFGPGF